MATKVSGEEIGAKEGRNNAMSGIRAG